MAHQPANEAKGVSPQPRRCLPLKLPLYLCFALNCNSNRFSQAQRRFLSTPPLFKLRLELQLQSLLASSKTPSVICSQAHHGSSPAAAAVRAPFLRCAHLPPAEILKSAARHPMAPPLLLLRCAHRFYGAHTFPPAEILKSAARHPMAPRLLRLLCAHLFCGVRTFPPPRSLNLRRCTPWLLPCCCCCCCCGAHAFSAVSSPPPRRVP